MATFAEFELQLHSEVLRKTSKPTLMNQLPKNPVGFASSYGQLLLIALATCSLKEATQYFVSIFYMQGSHVGLWCW